MRIASYTVVHSISAALLVVALAGCRGNTARQRPESPAQSAQYTQINPATSGTISGTIHFTGKAPQRIAIDMAQDPACTEASKTPNATEQIVVQDGKMANVFVYVQNGLGGRLYAAPTTPVVLDQKGCRYVPHVIGAMVGQPVEFRNSDPTMHNIHIVPPSDQDTAGFDISQPPMSGTQQHTFRIAGLMIPVRCNNHPWMEAFLNVVKNPFFAVSGSDGHFEIRNLPPGLYTLAAVQEKLGTQTQPITVESQKTTDVNFTFND